MEVDHVIPEALLSNASRRATVFAELGLAANFDINSYENWLPACGPCNKIKRDTEFKSSLLVQIRLQQLAAKAPKVAAMVEKSVSEAATQKALKVLEQAADAGNLDEETIQVLTSLITRDRPAEMANQPIRLTPIIQILFEKDGTQVVRGPYGIGTRRTDEHAQSSSRCPTCGHIGGWNGARCVVCGTQDDD